MNVKPKLGSPPVYLSERESSNSSELRTRFAAYEAALVSGSPDLGAQRNRLIDVCLGFVDGIRMSEHGELKSQGARVIDDCRKMMVVRDTLIDWVLLEMSTNRGSVLIDMLPRLFERLLELRSRPANVSSWSDDRLGAQSIFVYEMFLYLVAALIRSQGFDILKTIFDSQFLLPQAERGRENFRRFDYFRGYAQALVDELRLPDGRNYLSPEAELIKRQATRSDIKLNELIEAEVLIFMIALITEDLSWYPGTVHYASHGWTPEFFLRATRRSDFENLAKIVGLDDATTLKDLVRSEYENKVTHQSYISRQFFWSHRNPMELMNLEHLNTL